MDFVTDIENMEDENLVREKCINEWFIPVATAMLKECLDYNSIVIALAQYWNDEADDAVHIKFIPSSSKNPSWDTLFSLEHNDVAKKDTEEEIRKYGMEEFTGWSPYGYGSATERRLFGNRMFLDNIDSFIGAFSRYCKEGASQEMDMQDAYQPFMIFYREGNDIRIRQIGDLVRIWK